MNGNSSSLDSSTFNRLRRLYIIALSAIAFSIIVSQFIIRNFLKDQQDDSTVINVAGRQRMLSQKLSKEVLLLTNTSIVSERKALKDTLKSTLQLWQTSHKALLEGDASLNLSGRNSSAVLLKFSDLEQPYTVISEAAKSLIGVLDSNPEVSKEKLLPYMNKVIANEQQFLIKMDDIVNQYDFETNQKVKLLQHWELALTVFTLILLLAEFFFIFKPTARMVMQIINKLMVSEQKAINTAHEADRLREENEKSVKELRVLSQAMDKTLLFARVTSEGHILHIGSKFSRLFNFSNSSNGQTFSEILSQDKKQQEYLEHLLKAYHKSGWQGEIKAETKAGNMLWLEMYMVPVQLKQEQFELIIIASDITDKKQAQLEVETLTRESYEERMNQQKIISSKIIENQEKEQNRIAKDIHDGIGQMLTGLKYNLESINLDNIEKASKKVEDLKGLAASIIQGVRAATFNLTPPELSDYGIVPALTKLTQELSKLTGKKIVLHNTSNFNKRLDNLVEINIYRITQEAINNAIKYADSTYILITISHSEHILSVVIDDDGKGFDVNQPKNVRTGDGGMGMTFMKERINYINGRLFLSSSPETGTRITLNIPI
ncbi:type IV pili methyl-accepting chemotaxis transducer N-terminal domain-containing protein [Formosa sp. S-31]|uniref:ATP-binding protein n=1 Tax=Formosa sp. S-31 TaxID=2790949 RepID=UPI003EB7E3D9